MSYHSPVFIGDRRTTQRIHAFRSPGSVVLIPKNATLRDVRTGVEMGGYRRTQTCISSSIAAKHCTCEAHGLMGATTEVVDRSWNRDVTKSASAGVGPHRQLTAPNLVARKSHAIVARSASMIASRFSGGQGYFRSPTRFGARRIGIPSCSFTSAIQEPLGLNPARLRTRNRTSLLNDISRPNHLVVLF